MSAINEALSVGYRCFADGNKISNEKRVHKCGVFGDGALHNGLIGEPTCRTCRNREVVSLRTDKSSKTRLCIR